MKREDEQALADAGAITQLPDGRRGVRVSLQYRPRLAPGSREARRAELHQHFSQLAQRVASCGGTVDLDSLSVSGQTVEATLPVEHFDEINAEMDPAAVRVDPIVARKVTEE